MAKLSLKSTVKLNSGHELPLLGFGVYQIKQEQATDACKEALRIGYRHIDSASAYRNQGPSSASVAASGVPRSDVFFTTKVPMREYPLGYDNTLKLVDKALDETGLGYLDLVLIHSPYGGPDARKGAWRALVESVDEVHPWLGRADIVRWCRERRVAVEAYCPIVRGERFGDAKVAALAGKYAKTEAQVLLRWSLQKGHVPLVKSVTPSRIAENAAVFDFELTDAEVEDLATDDYSPCAWDPTVEPLDK
ncbi:hypothetical protein HIM_03740 [Hirsutella minnesotensis 3608]|uniref:NADP-dependent oxidoreductase domain-containing protein n=1 Tax=Hirsutella minnesotensis 3608 TaxID=1043627 RepID=A0A0F7ZVM3_9HYPO|nr:hypothetical protein HIM_03740 [Hirsutella minnesotensis 3608]